MFNCKDNIGVYYRHLSPRDEVSESVTTTDSGLGSDADISTHLPITQSHFKHCPPVLYFPAEHEKGRTP